jgi:hypothetical protein
MVVYTLFSMYYSVIYGRFCYNTIDDGGAILDLYLTEDDPNIFASIEFKDKHEEGRCGCDYVLWSREYDSIFSIFGYYNNRYDIKDILERDNDYRLGISIDRKLKKIIYQYQDHKFSITKDKKIFEYGDIKIFLKHDQVTKIILKKDEPLSIIVQDRWQLNPPLIDRRFMVQH